VSSPTSHPPSTLLLVLLSRGEFNDLCSDVSERGDGRTRTHRPLRQNIIDIDIVGGAVVVAVGVKLWYCGLNDLCGDMAEHGNGVITRLTPCGDVSA